MNKSILALTFLISLCSARLALALNDEDSVSTLPNGTRLILRADTDLPARQTEVTIYSQSQVLADEASGFRRTETTYCNLNYTENDSAERTLSASTELVLIGQQINALSIATMHIESKSRDVVSLFCWNQIHTSNPIGSDYDVYLPISIADLKKVVEVISPAPVRE